MLKTGIKISFGLFVVILQTVNMWLTAQFGYTYISQAFGENVASGILGSLYMILIADVAAIIWFFVFMKASESVVQRVISLGMAFLALGFSIMATLVQLVTNATSLVELPTAITSAVGLVALVFMLVLTASHIVSIAVYTLTNPEEFTRQWAMNLKAQVIDESLKTARKQIINEDKRFLVDHIREEVRGQVLEELGFQRDLTYTGYTQLVDPEATIIDQPAPIEPYEEVEDEGPAVPMEEPGFSNNGNRDDSYVPE